MKNKNIIPIFFSSDDNYIPCLGVSIYSLMKNANKEYNYNIFILNTGLKNENIEKIKRLEKSGLVIDFIDVSEKLKEFNSNVSLRLRDYYSNSIYYRIFIASLFPNYDKAIYLDSDTIIEGDISKLYNINLDDKLLGVCMDEVINNSRIFRLYSKRFLGIKSDKYFNSGVMVMNLLEFRKKFIEKKFLYLFNTYNFDSIAPDQDYLNYLCKDNVKYIDGSWDKMPNHKSFEEINLVHFNMFKKPWFYYNVPFEDYFWKYARETEFYNQLLKMREDFSLKNKIFNKFAYINVFLKSIKLSMSNYKMSNILKNCKLDKESNF